MHESWLTKPLFKVGDSPITPQAILAVPIGILLVLVLSDIISRLLLRGVSRTKLDTGSRHALVAIVRYLLIGGGVLAVMEESGVQLTAFHLFAGALGVGIGLGLQFVVTDFFSGLLLLFERSIKVGDRVEVDGVNGDVVNVGYRTTIVMTNEKKAHVIPNNKLVTNGVINWSTMDPRVRFSTFVTVAGDSDEDLVVRLLLEAADHDPGVLKEPKPQVLLNDFAADGLTFELRVWNEADVRSHDNLESRLNFLILKLFRKHGVTMPNRQNDVYIKEMVGMSGARPETTTG